MRKFPVISPTGQEYQVEFLEARYTNHGYYVMLSKKGPKVLWWQTYIPLNTNSFFNYSEDMPQAKFYNMQDYSFNFVNVAYNAVILYEYHMEELRVVREMKEAGVKKFMEWDGK